MRSHTAALIKSEEAGVCMRIYIDVLRHAWQFSYRNGKHSQQEQTDDE